MPPRHIVFILDAVDGALVADFGAQAPDDRVAAARGAVAVLLPHSDDTLLYSMESPVFPYVSTEP